MEITFGAWVRSKRGEEGEPGFITQQDLADRMGVTRGRVVQIEQLTKTPKYQTRQRIHAALGTTEDELRELGIIGDGVMQGRTATAHASAPAGAMTGTEGGTVHALAGTSRGEGSGRASLSIVRLEETLTDEQRELIADILAGWITPSEIRDDEPQEDRVGERKPRAAESS